jgi:hypothetical protein
MFCSGSEIGCTPKYSAVDGVSCINHFAFHDDACGLNQDSFFIIIFIKAGSIL